MPESLIIDLGELRTGAPEESPPRHTRGAHRHRRLAVVAAVLALLAGAAAAAPVPAGLELTRIPAGVGDTVRVDDDRLYLLGPLDAQSEAGDRMLTAYRLPDGRRLWSVRVGDVTRRFGSETTVAGVLLMSSYANDGTAEIIALDAASGAQRWRRPGWVHGLAPAAGDGPAQVLVASPAGGPAGRGPREVVVISALDPRTGEPNWSYRPPRGALWEAIQTWPDRRARHVVTGLPSGRVEVRDGATGQVRNAVDLRRPVRLMPSGDPRPWLVTSGDLVFVAADDGVTYTAYGLPRLDRRWQMAMSDSRWGWYGGWPSRGDLLYLQSPDGGIQVMDRRTGQLRWSGPWMYLDEVGALLLVAPRDGQRTGGEFDIELLDPATGRSRHRLGSWALAGGWPGRDTVLVSYDPRGSRAWFALLGPGDTDPRLVGVADGVLGDCWSGRHSMICNRTDNSIGIWRYR